MQLRYIASKINYRENVMTAVAQSILPIMAATMLIIHSMLYKPLLSESILDCHLMLVMLIKNIFSHFLARSSSFTH